jgi:hypothetical protein
LVEEFGRGVEVIVCSGVGAADDHDGIAGGGGGVVDAVVVDGGLEEVRIGFEPVVASLEWLRDARCGMATYHLGMLREAGSIL